MKVILHIQPKAATDEPASAQTLFAPFGPPAAMALPIRLAGALDTAVQPRAGPAPRHKSWTPDRNRTFLVTLPQSDSVTEAAKTAGIKFPTAWRFRNRTAGRAFRLPWQEAVALGRRRLTDEFVSRAAGELVGRMAIVNFVNFAAPSLSSAGEMDARMATVNFVNFTAPALLSAGEMDAPVATVNFVNFTRSRCPRRGSATGRQPGRLACSRVWACQLVEPGFRRTRISSSGASSTSSQLSPGPARSTTRKSLSASRTSRKWCQTPLP